LVALHCDHLPVWFNCLLIFGWWTSLFSKHFKMKIDKSIILLFFVAVLILSRKQESYCCFSVKMKYIWFSKNWEIKNEEKILTWEVARTVASQETWSCRWGLMWTGITVWKCWNIFYFLSVFILSFHLFFHLSVHIPDLPVLWFFYFYY